MKKIILIILSLILLVIPLFSQVDEQKFRLAESYEQGGDIVAALRLYEEIYQTNKSDKYFEPIARIYIQQNRFEELKVIVDARLKTNISSSLLIVAGDLNWRLGNFNEANSLWDKCRKDYSKDVQMYLSLSNTLNSLRLFYKVINVLLEAKQKFVYDQKVIDGLIRGYAMTGNYQDGFHEIIYYLSITKNLQQVQGKLFVFMSSDDAIQFIDNAFAREIKKNDDLQLLSFYGWYLRAINNFDKAFDIFVQIDRIKNSKGNDIYRFADESKRDGQYDVALKAYRFVADMGKASPYANSAIYQYTKTMEEKLFSKSNITKDEATGIIKSYQKIIADFPKTDYSEQSKLRIAMLEDIIMNNKKNAMTMLENVISTKFSTLYVIQAMNELSEIYLKDGDLEKAKQSIANIQQIYHTNNKQKNNQNIENELNRARYNQSEILYYSGNADSALSIYYSLTDALEDDVANDALERIAFIKQNKDFVMPLNSYANAEYLQRQGKLDAALLKYNEVIKSGSGEQIGENALIKAAEIEITLKKMNDAKLKLSNYLENNVYPLYGDNALFLLASIAQSENKKDEAIDYYADILVKYPRSVLINKARKQIRILRDDNQ